jgi:hypothetical protein
MPITNGYCTLNEFKERFYPTDASDDLADDKTIEAVITAVSREIDGYCQRRFWKNTVNEVRYFTAKWGNLLEAADVVSVTGVATDLAGDRAYSTALAVTDYDLEPYNAVLDGVPYTRLRITLNSSKAFLTSQRGNKLTGIFGWPSIPQPVNEACIIQSIRMFKRKDAPFGVFGSVEMGQVMAITKLDPDVQMLLEPYVKHKVIW